MISARHLVPGRVLLGTALVPGPHYMNVEERVHCMVVGLTQADRRCHARKKDRGSLPGPEGWSVLVIWLDGRCEPRIQTVHVPVNNDWEPTW